MDAELKARWLDALRSGKYKQGRSALKKRVHGYQNPETLYCCLGVLACAGLGKRGSRIDGLNLFTIDGYVDYLSEGLLEQVGLTDRQQNDLAEMNDKGKSFEEIADYIEANL